MIRAVSPTRYMVCFITPKKNYLGLPGFTWVYLGLPGFTWVYLGLPIKNC